MLAPRLAMLCKGTAWSQVKSIEPGKLTDPDGGVKVLLLALSSWDEAAKLQTYDKCEKAPYRIQQKSDETTMSFVNRLSVAFHELGDNITIKELRAFILLRQSNLNAEDKRKVITLTGGTLDASKIENAMRTLSTKILGSTTEGKKRIYPANYVEEDDFENANMAEEDKDEDMMIEQLAEDGDEDAIFVTEYEGQILDLVQELPELAQCFTSYTETSNYATITYDQGRQLENDPEIVDQLPWNVVDRALVVERAELAILDTGASKTVIGKDNFETFVSQLPVHVRRQIKRADSQVVFRFGNTGVLPSLGSAYVPYGKKWFKIEIVKGKTPFLLSNPVMRQLRGQLNFDTNTLWIPELGKSLGLTLNSKGLYLVDIRELLGIGTDFENALETHHDDRSTNAAVPAQLSPQHPLGVDPLVALRSSWQLQRTSWIRNLDGRFKGKAFLETVDNHPEHVRYIINRRVTAKSLVSFQNFCRAVESVKVQKKMEAVQEKTDKGMTHGPILPRTTAAKSSSSSHKRPSQSTWEVIAEQELPMTMEGNEEQKQILATQIAMLQRQLDQLG
ncbi:unnamed protein product [Symbiodinium pilosum]|uniref:Uncharacterized protein n=1 Tax=Symbiodinium pilosum TaxID=2952 RepID=A0A812REQ9_SYMPI|nr:unnamed protein product [Symbiodinium pilosum]